MKHDDFLSRWTTLKRRKPLKKPRWILGLRVNRWKAAPVWPYEPAAHFDMFIYAFIVGRNNELDLIETRYFNIYAGRKINKAPNHKLATYQRNMG